MTELTELKFIASVPGYTDEERVAKIRERLNKRWRQNPSSGAWLFNILCRFLYVTTGFESATSDACAAASRCSSSISFSAKLPTPISVAEVARRLDINLHGLYRNANREARVLSERWKQDMKRKGEQSIEQARSIVEAACLGMVADGQAVNLRSLKTRLTPEEFGKVQGAVYLLQEFRDELT